MKKHYTNMIRATSTLATLALAGCTTPITKQNEAEVKSSREHLETMVQEQRAQKPSSFTEQTGPTISIKPLSAEQQAEKEKAWLTNIKGITLDPAKNATITATAIVRMLRDRGINITSTMPLDGYTYSGFGVTNVNAETALLVFMGSMGLDFSLDNARQLITIEPMKTQTWYLDIGNRKTSFNAGGDSTSDQSGNSGNSSNNNGNQAQNGAGQTQQATTGVGNQTTGSNNNGTSGSTSSNNSSSTTGSNGITTSDDLWTLLDAELKARMTILVPRTGSGLSAAMPAQAPEVPSINQPNQIASQVPQQGGNGLYVSQAVGRSTINPVTGAITAQAPRYILKQLDEYLTQTQAMYHTLITFEAELFTMTTNNDISEGIDWSAFNTFSGGTYTSIAQNSIYGGAVFSPATGTASLVDSLSVTNAIPGGNALFGVASLKKKFAVLNGFVSSIGKLKIKETPVATTTSGTPVRFKNTVTRSYEVYQQNAASGGVGGGAAVATNTISVPYDTGSILRLNPRYDVRTGLIRIQYALERKILQGWETKQSPITFGNSIQILTTKKPVLGNTIQDGELLVKNNDLVVVGGSTEDSDSTNESGVSGLNETILKSLTGSGTGSKSTTTYYFALHVTLSKKN